LTRIKSGANAASTATALDPGQVGARTGSGHSTPNPTPDRESVVNIRKLRRHLYIAPILVAALAAVLTAYAGVPHDGGQDAAAAPAAGMSIPF
jgi:hypothetical protein